MPYDNKQSWTAANWNAYVPAGKTKDDRRARLEEVPDKWRDEVRRHVVTVFELAKRGKVR